MAAVSFIICIAVIALTAVLLYKKYNPQGLLLISGLLMVALATALGINPVDVSKSTGAQVFDVFRFAEEKFFSNFSRAGLMIMTIAGYVAFMNKIEATNMLVYLAIKPLSVFRKRPYLAAVLAIPVGQLLFITTPSAAGVGLLLVATLYPILVNLGVSRLTALTAISAATIFDQGPGSANTAAASSLIGITPVEYFLQYQLPCIIPTTAFLMVFIYFFSRWSDRRDSAKGKDIWCKPMDEACRPDAPLYYAFLPVLPIVVLIFFSSYIGIFDVHLSTTVAMLISFLVSLVCVMISRRSVKKVFPLFSTFWQGMGNSFMSVVTLIVTAEIFSGGLISLGFIDNLVKGSTSIGLGGTAITIVITVIVFFAAMLMGSGNAAFFSFGPLMPQIAGSLGFESVKMILPTQLCASIGRATSPIAGVIVAISGVAGVSPLEVARRNTVPMICGAICLNLVHYIV